MRHLHELSRKMLRPGGLEGLLQDVMDVAVATVGADQGTLQLLEGNSLRLAVNRGHKAPFLKFFESADTITSACWEASKRGERVVVPDVKKNGLFAAPRSLAVLQAANVRSMQCTPMVSRTGRPVGILSTFWRKLHRPGERDLWRIDLLVRQATDLIEVARAEEALQTSESTLRSFYESAPLMMGVVEIPADNSDIIHVYDNPATDQFFGRLRGSTVGQSALGMEVPKVAVSSWIKQYRLAEQQGKPVQFEYWHAKWRCLAVGDRGEDRTGRFGTHEVLVCRD